MRIRDEAQKTEARCEVQAYLTVCPTLKCRNERPGEGFQAVIEDS